MLPKTIFKFEPFSLRAIQNLKCNSVYFGSPSSFNDPFDCAIIPPLKEPTDVEIKAIVDRFVLSSTTPDNVRDQLLRAPKQELRNTVIGAAKSIIEKQCADFNANKGVTCFSERNDNMLMWSHYGGQHRGFCLEFKTDFLPFSKLRSVEYGKSLPLIDVTQLMLEDNNFEHLLDIFCTKSDDWAYEREWRAFHQKAGTLFTYDAGALKAIYFGAKMSEQDIDMLCLILHGQIPSVQLFRGRKSNSEFRIVFDMIGPYVPYAEAKTRGLVLR